MAVTKTFPSAAVEAAARAGHRLFGENKVQEGVEKIPQCPTGLEWHLIGHLQSNKAKPAIEHFDVIQTLDSPKIARRVGRLAETHSTAPGVMIQVNVGDEPQKFGVEAEAVAEIVEIVDSETRLPLEGLMALPPYHPDPERARPYFQQLRRLLEEINRGRTQPLTELSMGMSGDYLVAIEEGSTLLRIGTAIFGPRS